MAFTLKKNERLHHKTIIDQLMEKKQTVLAHPFLLYAAPLDLYDEVPAQVAFAVPKKKVKKAVTRNRIKRQMRECYRLMKPEIYQKCGENQFAFMIIFLENSPKDFFFMKQKMEFLFERFFKMESTIETKP